MDLKIKTGDQTFQTWLVDGTNAIGFEPGDRFGIEFKNGSRFPKLGIVCVGPINLLSGHQAPDRLTGPVWFFEPSAQIFLDSFVLRGGAVSSKFAFGRKTRPFDITVRTWQRRNAEIAAIPVPLNVPVTDLGVDLVVHDSRSAARTLTTLNGIEDPVPTFTFRIRCMPASELRERLAVVSENFNRFVS